MMKKQISGGLAGILAMVLLAGCAKGIDNPENYKTIVDDYAVFTLEQDGDSAAFDEALGAVGLYLEDYDDNSLQNARSIVEKTLNNMEAEAADTPSYELSSDLGALLNEYGLDEEEYVINANMRVSYLSEYIDSLKTLQYYLDLELQEDRDLLRDDLEFLYQFQTACQTCERGYYYYSINYWFAGWEGSQKEYVEEKVIRHLKSYAAENAVWEDNREAVEQKMSLYLDQIQELGNRMQEHIGRSREELYRMEQTQ